MADGDITGRLARYGTVVPGSAAETVITGCEITLPTAEGFYHLFGRIATCASGLSGQQVIVVQALAYVDAGAAVISTAEGTIDSQGAAGIVGGFSASGYSVRLTVTDCNGTRAVGLLELFGVEQALSS